MLDHMITVRAESVEKAIEKGLRQLGVSESEAEIHVISEGKKGLFGFGKQDAIVEITRPTEMTFKEMTRQLEREQDENTDNMQVSPSHPSQHDKVTEPEVTEDTMSSATEPATPPHHSSDEAESVAVEPIVNDQTVTPTPDPQVAEADEDREEARAVEVEPVLKSQEGVTEAQVTSEAVPSDAKSEDTTEESNDGLSLEASAELVARYLERVITEYGADANVSFEVSGHQVTFNIDTDKSGLVIGKHGKIINALQIISHTLLQNHYRHRVSVLLNVGDYRDRRAGVLEQIAQRTADDVLRTKQTVILDPLPAYERKQIHAHLAKFDHIDTHSEGREPNRYLVVEYQEEI